jgi:glycosyltransferase involved in cell wall biosynthesis
VHLVCPWQVKKGIASQNKNIFFESFKPARKRIFRVLTHFNILCKILKIFRRTDIFHFHDLDLLPLMTIVSFFKPVVYDIHENYPDEMLCRDYLPTSLKPLISLFVKFLGYICSLKIKNIVLVVESQRKDYPKHCNYIVMHNYASVNTVLQVKDDYFDREPAVIFTGSMYESNGCFLVVNIAKILSEKKITPLFLITDRFSSSSTKEAFFKSINDNSLENIKIINQVSPPQIVTLLNHATIAISPNLRTTKQVKALPTKIFEYMAAGLPQVSSNLPLISQILSDKKTGILADPDMPETFADAIEYLLANPQAAFLIGKNAQNKFIERYNWEIEVEKLLKFYKKIIYS